MRTRLATAPGVELDVVQLGDPTGIPLLLLHGLSDSEASMPILMDELPRGIRAIAITQRGHGDSSKPTSPYTMEAFVADAVAVLDQLSVRQAVVFGHSMGSVVAQLFAAKHPDRVAALILEGAFPGLKGNPAVEGFYETEIAGLCDPIDAQFARDFQLSSITRPVPPEFLELVTAEACKLPANAWKAIIQDMMTSEATPDLPAIRAPTLLLWGAEDSMVLRPDQDRLASGIRGAELVVFEGTGHAPHWEEPARVAGLITDFVQRHVAPVAA